MFQKDIHISRGIAILFIVGGHARLTLDWSDNMWLGNMLADLLANGTVLFVFISGYLFQALSPRFEYSRFLKAKIRNVVTPYLIVSIPALVHAILVWDPVAKYPQLAGLNTVEQVGWFIVKGGAHVNYPLWFIPMISLFFLISPIFMFVIRNPRTYVAIVPLLIISLLLHRAPYPHLDTLRLMVYFLAPYLIGMLTSQFRDDFDRVVGERPFLLIAAYIVLLASQNVLAIRHGVHSSESWFSTENGIFDWSMTTKLCLCFVLISVGKRYSDVLYSKFKFVGSASFGIYFLHAYFLTVYAVLAPAAWTGGNFAVFVILFAVVMLACVGSCWIAQRMFGKYSRQLLGC